MTMLPHIASRVLDTPLVIGQAKLEAILAVIGPRIGVEAPAPAVMNGDGRRRGVNLVTPEGIAVTPVFGTLVKRAGAIEAASGLTSYGHLEEQIMDAATDPAVRAILLGIDSPGGEAAGVFDLSDLVYEARSLKPVWAVADEEALSGAYAIASAAERLIVPRTGGLGSIGVVAVHVDRSARDTMEGFRTTTVYQPVEKGVIDRVSRHGEAYRGEGGFAILRDDEDDLNDQDGSSGRNKHEQGANSARHGLLRGAGADELAHQQR